jgi:uncharacterized protein YijF (DUF1287 family)
MKRWRTVFLVHALPVVLTCGPECSGQQSDTSRPGEPAGFVEQLSAAAIERTRVAVRYDGSYRSIGYPGGDVPEGVGVCSDLVIRAYRVLGIDLQQAVHEDMSETFAAYPDRWGLGAPDPNIDHRRVPNLEVFFARRGVRLPVTDDPGDYLPGDLVTWNLGPLPHIGIVVSVPSNDGERFQIAHNIGRGPELEDMLFDYEIVGHFRYYGSYGD